MIDNWSNKIIRKIFTVFCLVGFCIMMGCSDIEPLFDVTKLANQPTGVLQAKLGKAKEITPITSYPNQMPGEHRTYVLSDGSEMQVKFYKDKAVLFTVWLVRSTSDPRTALHYVGIKTKDIMPLPIIRKGPFSRTWSGTVNGISFKEISSQATTNDKWDIIQIIVEGAPQ